MGTMSSLRPTRLVAALVALVLLLTACSSSEPPAVVVSGNNPATAAKDIATTLDAEGFTIFAALVEHAGMTDLFVQGDDDETLTVFAPSDAAFGELSEGVEAVLMGEEDVLVMPAEGEESPTVAESDESNTGSQTASTDEEDAEADAGSDDTADATGDVSTEEQGEGADDDEAESDGEAGSDAGSDDEASGAEAATPISAEPLSPDETAELLQAILEYHVAEGTHQASELLEESRLDTLEGTALTLSSREEPPASEDGEPTTILTVDGVDVSATDLIATNGVIHTVDEVLVPADHRADIERLIASIPVATDALSTLRGTGEHTQLVAALESAGLSGELTDASAVTVFAPTDAAFDSLTAAEQALLADPVILRHVLQFHVVEGRSVARADVLNREQVATAEGQRATIATSGSEQSVDEVPIEREIPATNGVVHVIGELLIPDSVRGPGGF